MKTWKRLVSGLLSLLLLASLTGGALAAETEAPKPAGQFSQWFPRLGIDPDSPKSTEDVLSRMGTAVKQTKKASGASVTLNGAVWDGERVLLSLVVKGAKIPKELTAESRLYTEECSLKMPQAQWKEYVRQEETREYTENDLPMEQLEERIQSLLKAGQDSYWRYYGMLGFSLRSQEKDTLTFEVSMDLEAFLEHPELTLHVENIALYENDEPVSWLGEERTGPGPGTSVLKGPFDFTFKLEKGILPVRYTGDAKVTYEKIPMNFTKFELSVFSVDVGYEVLAPMNPLQSVRPDAEPEALDPNKLDPQNVQKAVRTVVQGVWTRDGKYVDLSECGGGLSLTTDETGQKAIGSTGRAYPYAIDPAAVTAVNLGGTRVELGKLKLAEK